MRISRKLLLLSFIIGLVLLVLLISRLLEPSVIIGPLEIR
jgi:hypothetical protein